VDDLTWPDSICHALAYYFLCIYHVYTAAFHQHNLLLIHESKSRPEKIYQVTRTVKEVPVLFCVQRNYLRGYENSTYDYITMLKPSDAIGDLQIPAPPTDYNHMHIICIIIIQPAVSLASHCSLQVPTLVSPSEVLIDQVM